MTTPEEKAPHPLDALRAYVAELNDAATEAKAAGDTGGHRMALAQWGAAFGAYKLATDAFAAVERERDEALRAAKRNEDIDRMNLESARLENDERDGYRSALADLTAAITAFFKGPANDDAANRLHAARKNARATLKGEAAESRLAGAPPPVAPAPLEYQCVDCNDTGTRWRDGTAYECECPGNQPSAPLADDGAAPPSERPATVQGFADEIESLRADRALIQRYGEALALVGDPSAGDDGFDGGMRLRDASDALRDRALALAAQGRGEGDKR